MTRLRDCYGATTKDGLPALVVPLAAIGDRVIGRRAAGCELRAIRSARFHFRQEIWEGAAAALVCTERAARDIFSVLAVDIATRLPDKPSWATVAQSVAEWQALLAAAENPSATSELGLWGELWFIDRAVTPSLLVAGWRGPERDATDFFVDGVAAEVKASRQARQHHVSLSQVQEPVGEHPSYLLSLWVKEDPVRGLTVTELVARIELAIDDRAALLRGLLRAGYSQTSGAYTAHYVVLDEPEWYATAAVPTVRVVDPGVTNIRYRVSLDVTTAVERARANELWTHFLGQSYTQ
ncbi:MAG TPA: PD-(D/E)XK motif protein [Kofleriaceae bacterium]